MIKNISAVLIVLGSLIVLSRPIFFSNDVGVMFSKNSENIPVPLILDGGSSSM